MPTSSFITFYDFIEKLAEKVHDLGTDQFMVALTNVAPDATTDAVLTDLTEIAYTYCSSRILTISGSAQTAGTYKWTVADIILSATGGDVGPFQYAVVYNNTAASKNLVGYANYGSATTIANGEQLTLNFDDANGTLQIAPV